MKTQRVDFANHQKFSMNHQRGFTLIEALVAFGILIIGLTALFRFHSTNMGATAESKIRAQAITLAEAKLEQVRSYRTSAEYDNRMTDGSGMGAYAAGVDFAADFTRNWTVVDNSANPDIPDSMTVVVSWTDRTNNNQSVSLTSNLLGGNPEDSGVQLALALAGGNDPSGGFGGGDPGGGDPGDDDPGDGDPGGGDPGGGDPGGDDSGGDDPPPNSYQIIISGSVAVNPQGNFSSFEGAIGSGTHTVLCNSSATAYSCVIGNIPADERWSGTITLTSNLGNCSPSLEFANLGISEDQSVNVTLGKSGNSCALNHT